MIAPWIQLAHAMSRSLDCAEREAVFGDFAELGKSDWQILIGTGGLVLRRQLGLWKYWKPWFVLMAIVIPTSTLLAMRCDELGQSFFPNLVMWMHHRMPYETGVSSGALWAALGCQAAALVTWSWTSALALGMLSRKTMWENGALFFLLCVFCGLYGSVFSLRFLLWSPLAWIGVWVKFLVVVLPAYCGLRLSSRSLKITYRAMVPLAAWTATIGCLAFWTRCWGDAVMDNWSRGASALTLVQLAQLGDTWRLLLPHWFAAVVLTGPVLYLLASKALSNRRVVEA